MRKKRVVLRTRRQRALRQAVALLLLVAVADWVFGVALFPRQALRHGEELAGVRDTEIVAREYVSGRHWPSFVYLTANEHGAVLTLTWFGGLCTWSCYRSQVVECDGAAPVYGRHYKVSRKGREYMSCLFGQVKDQAVVGLEVSFRRAVDGETSGQGASWEEVERVSLEAENWHELDGERYFLLLATRPELPPGETEEAFLLGYDAAGALLYEQAVS